MDAYVYLRVQPGKVQNVVVELAGKHGVRYAVAVIGDWDVMAAVEGADLLDIAKRILSQIHPIQGVVETYTAPVVPLDRLGIHGGFALAPAPMQQRGDACYVHIEAEAGSVAQLVERLAEMEDVAGIAVIAGRHDLLVEIPQPWESATAVILDNIHTLPGVVRTNTLAAVPRYEEEMEIDPDQPAPWS